MHRPPRDAALPSARMLASRTASLAWLLAGLASLASCSGPSPSEAPARPSRTAAPEERSRAPEAAPLPPSEWPAPPALVAIGDVHGDVDALRDALRLGGAIDGSGHWSGGALWVVQVGDLLDRGDEEDEILALLDALDDEALAAGGRLFVLNGNHEVMNAQGDFRYVTAEGFDDFDGYGDEAPRAVRTRYGRNERGRAAAFAPGGPLARTFASHPTVMKIGDTIFVHGGLTPRDAARGLDRINEEARAFFLAEDPLSAALSGEDSPTWHRGYAVGESAAMCAELEAMLTTLSAERLVIGHTVQEEGITSACEGRVWRIDVGLSDFYGGPTEVLSIRGDEVRILGR